MTVAIRAAQAYAYALREACLPVMDENVPPSVRIARHEVRGTRVEGHEAAVSADRRGIARSIPLCTVGGNADPIEPVRLPVVDEDIQ